MSLLPARSAVEQGRLSGDCRSGRPVPTLPAAEGDMGLRLAWCAALAGAFAVGCGGDPKADPGLPPSGGPPPSEVAVAIRPAAVSLLPLQTQQFSADVSNAADRSVDWSVAEGAGGSIDAMGLYVAPSNSGTFHVVATSRADRKAFAAAVVTVTSLPPQIIVNILPSQATLEVNRTQRFSAVGSGAADPRSPGPSPKEAPAAPSTATASTQLEERRRHIGDVVGGRGQRGWQRRRARLVHRAADLRHLSSRRHGERGSDEDRDRDRGGQCAAARGARLDLA